MTDYQASSLFSDAFSPRSKDHYAGERSYFREQYLRLRDKVAQLVKLIPQDIPGLTVHDITHLDALWETASTIAGPGYTINPAEAYVFGAAILLHDAGLALASYPRGIAEIYETDEWRDNVAALLAKDEYGELGPVVFSVPPDPVRRMLLAKVLRSLHAKRAGELPNVSWAKSESDPEYLIEDADLRHFYGAIIGKIAASHHAHANHLPEIMGSWIGAFAKAPNEWSIEPLKLACLLRLADAAQIDQRRAPRFLRSLTWPEGLPGDHWNFQSKLAKPALREDALIITSGPSFTLADADAWWLCFDAISMIDDELRGCDVLLENCKLPRLAAKRVRGAESPKALSEFIRTTEWEPVDTTIKVGDVPRLVKMLGGSQLYGQNDTVPIRELVQNSVDAIRARRLFENRPPEYGAVRLSISAREGSWWLEVEDDGIGMSVRTLTGALLDFGRSFWSSDAAQEEFPGLTAKGMKPIGRFGIGFFSVFMLGDRVLVCSRRHDAAQEATRTLEFRSGLDMRPILRKAVPPEYLLEGGTRVSVLLKKDPYAQSGLLAGKTVASAEVAKFEDILPGMCPSIDIDVNVGVQGDSVRCVSANDWRSIEGQALLRRVGTEKILGERFSRPLKGRDLLAVYGNNVRQLADAKGTVHGRACIVAPTSTIWSGGVITIGGFVATGLNGIGGVLVGGGPETAVRDWAMPSVGPDVLCAWASEQAVLLAKSDLSGSEKLRAAGFVMLYGGDPGDLPFAQRGGGYLNRSTLEASLSDIDQIVVFEGDRVEFDEDTDSCHPRDFSNAFEPDASVIFLPKMPWVGRELGGGRGWPACILDSKALCSHESVLREIVERSWGEFEEWADGQVVGTVRHDDIQREVTVFRRARVRRKAV
jgi:hypothetical protein